MRLEGAERVNVVGRDEHSDRHATDTDRLDDPEAIDTGHLHVEKHDLRLEAGDARDRLTSARRFADDLETASGLEMQAHATPCERLVVDDEHAHRSGRHASSLTVREFHDDAQSAELAALEREVVFGAEVL